MSERKHPGRIYYTSADHGVLGSCYTMVGKAMTWRSATRSTRNIDPQLIRANDEPGRQQAETAACTPRAQCITLIRTSVFIIIHPDVSSAYELVPLRATTASTFPVGTTGGKARGAPIYPPVTSLIFSPSACCTAVTGVR